MVADGAGSQAVRRGRHRVRLGRVQVVVAAFAAVCLTFAGLLVGGAVGNAATYAPVCDQYGSQGIGGKYVAQNDRWGSSKPQCITPFDTGFTLSTAQGTNTSGPSGYPSIYRGCVYGYCTPSSVFPVQVASMGAVRSNYSTSGPTAGGTNQYNTAYDIWFDPNMNQSGRNTGLEMMIWLNRTPWVQPVGKPYYDVNIGGTVWTIWYGKIDLPVVSYVRKTPTTSVTNLPIEAFAQDAMRRGVLKSTWYLTSVQAGFEPWTGGQGLKVNNFSVTRNGA